MHNNFIKSFRMITSFRLIKWIIIPILLLFLWFSSSLVNGSYENPSVLEYYHNQNIAGNPNEGKILKNRKITAKFLAKKNNLGIVSVKIQDVPRVDFKKEDILIFKIKEDGKSSWQYTNRYRSGQMKPGEYFPFGFGIIEDSKDKSYVFEISSLRGDPSNAIQVDYSSLKFTTKYKFHIAEILKDKNEIVDFSISKIIAVFTNTDYLLETSFFLLPFVFYMIFILVIQDNVMSNRIKKGKRVSRVLKHIPKQLLIKKKSSFALLCLSLILVYLFAIEIFTTGLTFGLLGFWITAIYINKFRARSTYLLAFIIICLSVLSIYFNLEISIDEVSAFAFMLILLGLLQDLYQK